MKKVLLLLLLSVVIVACDVDKMEKKIDNRIYVETHDIYSSIDSTSTMMTHYFYKVNNHDYMTVKCVGKFSNDIKVIHLTESCKQCKKN